MKTKAGLFAVAALSLTIFSFKPVKDSQIRHLQNGNILLAGVKISSEDLKSLKEIEESALIFKKNVTKTDGSTSVTEQLITTTATALSAQESENARVRVENIMAKYE